MLDRVAGLLERDLEELAPAETLNTGKAMRESRWDIADVVRVFRYYADLADKEAGRLVDTGNPNALSRIVYEPVGVCALIAPWNYPLLQLSWKVAPALAAGNTVGDEAGAATPLTAIHLTRLLEEAGVPAGVVNLVLGPGDRVGQALADSPGVDLISLTGGIEAGTGAHARRGRQHQAGRARARRQEPEHRLRRRRLRDRRRQRPDRRVRPFGPGLLRRLPGDRRRTRSTTGSSKRSGRGRTGSGSGPGRIPRRRPGR